MEVVGEFGRGGHQLGQFLRPLAATSPLPPERDQARVETWVLPMYGRSWGLAADTAEAGKYPVERLMLVEDQPSTAPMTVVVNGLSRLQP